MTLPEQDRDTGYLPGGDHHATLEEVLDRYTGTMKRRELCANLKYVVEELRSHGVQRICVEGSFTNVDRKRPGDVDVWYEAPPGSDPDSWGQLAPANRRQLEDDLGIDLCKHPMRGGITRTGWDPTPLPDYWRDDDDVPSKGLIWLEDDDNGSGK